ncbi:sigma-70 family RNA polymerase sigma factor [Kribbella sp. NPDC005582]|uniref:RNA polymerase sigma factor n=1 Tax=Kribbella sp. NPDC005582 TaxID=3156893 RepID=UPI0033BC36AB
MDRDQVPDVAVLYRRSWPRLIGVLVSIGGSRADAEEVAQDAYVKLLGRWESISRYEDPEAWVRSVAVRTLISRLRRQQVAAKALTKLTGRRAEVVAPPDGESLDVAAALAVLPAAQRAVVVLHHVMDLPVDQIAEELQVPVGTVKSRLARARQALQPLLEVKEVPENA